MHPRMTSTGRAWAAVIGILLAFALPKRVECGYPGGECTVIRDRERCVRYEVEPWGFSLLERVWGGNVGFAYSAAEDCR